MRTNLHTPSASAARARSVRIYHVTHFRTAAPTSAQRERQLLNDEEFETMPKVSMGNKYRMVCCRC